jgi:hypothetical protein
MSEDKRQLAPGSYEGTIEDYGISKNSKDKPQAFIKFKIMKGEGQGFAELTSYGGLSEVVAEGKKKSPAERTITVLLDCEFSGMNPTDLASGRQGGTIALGKAMALTIQDNDYKDVLRSQIAFVNPLGGGGMKTLSKDEVEGKVNTSALRAILLKQKENRPTEGMPASEEDIPF